MAKGTKSTSDSWRVGGTLSSDQLFEVGTGTSGYTTDGNYNWAFADGNGFKIPMLTTLDVGANTFYRAYLRNNTWEFEEVS